MSLLNTTLQTLVVRLRDLSGNVSAQKLHNRIFDAYEAKSLVFEAITPQQQQVMAQFGGTVPTLHPVGQPVLLESWEELTAIHNDANMYQLLPRRAKTNASYQVLRAICMSRGSPFSMDNRLDPVDLKFVFRAADFETRNAFNTKSADKLGNSIWFDGILQAKEDSGFVMCHHALSPANINQVCASIQFLREWTKEKGDGDRHRQLREGYGKLLGARTHIFCGTVTPPGRELINYARGKNVHIYGKKGNQYQFQS